MFNPENSTDVKQIWRRLSTFYNLVDVDTKLVVETYWKALLNGLEGLYYDLTQSTLANFLDYTTGYIEDVQQMYDITFAQRQDGKYSYKLPIDKLYLTIPLLSGVSGKDLYTEGVDYDIVDNSYLLFEDGVVPKSGKYIANQALYLLPSITKIYFPAFGEPDIPEKVVSGKYYLPYTKGYNDLSFFDRQVAYAKHLKLFVQSVSNSLMRGPSFKNLYRAYCVLFGMPFSYEAGQVSDIIGQEITVSGETLITYVLPTPLTSAVEVGQSVDKFHILASGISLHDYIKSPDVINEITVNSPEEAWYTFGIQKSNRVYGLKNYVKFLDFFATNVKPVGLAINEFNLPPRGSANSNKIWYEANNPLSLSGLITDPELDILSYSWSQNAPLISTLGDNLEAILFNSTSISCNGTLKIPPVDRELTFKLTVSDSDNSPSFDVRINVSGVHQFTTWGNSSFVLGDAELRYKDLPGAI